MSEQAIGYLQTRLLKATLQESPLPGFEQHFQLPDLSFILSEPVPILAEENLADQGLFEEIQFPLEILPLRTIQQRAEDHGDVAYLHFTSIDREDDGIWLTLRAKIAPHNPDQQILGLSGVRVGFQEKSPDGWIVVEGPIFFAT